MSKKKGPKEFLFPDFRIEDSELEIMKSKFTKAFKIFEEYQTDSGSATAGVKAHLNDHRNIFNRQPEAQADFRQQLLKRMVKGSFNHKPELLPSVMYNYNKKQSTLDLDSQHFISKMTKHFSKKITNLETKLDTLNEEFVTYCNFHQLDEDFPQKKEAFELLGAKIEKDLQEAHAIYTRVLGSDEDPVDVEKIRPSPSSSSKLAYFVKDQPPQVGVSKLGDYKLFLNDKLKKHKATRKILKYKAIIESLPYSIQGKVLNQKENIIDRHKRDNEALGMLYNQITELPLIKEKLVENCKLFGINDSIEIDNGAFVLFKVEMLFKTRFEEQAQAMRFIEYTDKPIEQKVQRTEDIQLNDSDLEDVKKRALKKVDWLDKFQTEKEPSPDHQTQQDMIYKESVDSLLKGWLNFVQIDNFEVISSKLAYKLQKTREAYHQQGIVLEEIFFQLLKGYWKLLILRARDNIIRIHDALNYFRSVEKLIVQKTLYLLEKSNKFQKQLIPMQINTPNESHLNRYDSKDKMVSTSKSLVGATLENIPSAAAVFNHPSKNCDVDDIAIHENTKLIEIYDYKHKLIMYDLVVQQDFKDLSEEFLKVGAHLIDSIKSRLNTNLSTLDQKTDIIDRETLFNDLLDYETDYCFSKVIMLSHYVAILRNTYLPHQRNPVIAEMRRLIKRRPKFDLLQESLKSSYEHETESLKILSSLLESMIVHQMSEEEKLDEYQKSLYHEGAGSKIIDSVVLEDSKFSKVRFYDSFFEIFSAIDKINKGIQYSVRQMNFKYNHLLALFIQKLLLEESFNIWQQINFNVSITPFAQDYDILENDILLELPRSTDIIKHSAVSNPLNNLEVPSRDEAEGNKPDPSGKSFTKLKATVLSLKKEEKSPYKNIMNLAGKLAGEELILKTYIEFLRIKELCFRTIQSLAFMTRIYQDHIRIFDKEHLYKGLDDQFKLGGLGNSAEIQKLFFNMLVDMDNVTFTFELKEVGDCRMIVMNNQKLNQLLQVTEYFLVHEQLVKNAIRFNYFFINEIERVSISYAEFLHFLHSETLSHYFYNIIEKKRVWSLHSKIGNFNLSRGATPKDPSVGNTRRPKMEYIRDYCNLVWKYIYFDTLRLQTIELATNLTEMVKLMGLDTKGIFKIQDLKEVLERKLEEPVEAESPSPRMENVAFKTAIEKTEERFDKIFFDEGGNLANIFTLPSVRDIIDMEIQEENFANMEEIDETEQIDKQDDFLFDMVTEKASPNLAFRSFDDDPGKNKIRKPFKRVPALTYLEGTKMFKLFEILYSMKHIIHYEFLFATMESNSLDLILFLNNAFTEKEEYTRNLVRFRGECEIVVSYLTRVKDNCETLKKDPRSKDPSSNVARYLRKIHRRCYQMFHLVLLDLLQVSRQKGELEQVAFLQTLLGSLVYRKLENVYKVGSELVTYDPMSLDAATRESERQKSSLTFHNSAIINFVKFLFVDPREFSRRELSKQKCFYEFTTEEFYSTHDLLRYGLLKCKKALRSEIGSRITELRIALDFFIQEKRIISNRDIMKYELETNSILKQNVKNYIQREILISLKDKNIPLGAINNSSLADLEKKILYHFRKTLLLPNNSHLFKDEFTKQLPAPKSEEEAKKVPELPTKEEQIHIKTLFYGVVLNSKYVKLIQTLLEAEFEKRLLDEGTVYYASMIRRIQAETGKSKDYIKALDQELVLTASDPNELLKIPLYDGSSLFTLNPVFQNFASKVINKALLVEIPNGGESLFISMQDLRFEIQEANKLLVDYLAREKSSFKRQIDGKVKSLEEEIVNIRAQLASRDFELKQTKHNNDKLIQATVSQLSSQLQFEVDTLKKRIEEMIKEQDFMERNLREKIREEFKEKLLNDDFNFNKLMKRYHEYREGQSVELRKMIEIEKNSTEKAIRDKTKKILITELEKIPRYKRGVIGLRSSEGRHSVFDYDDEEDITEEETKRIYAAFKKLRMFYLMKEVVRNEKRDKEIALISGDLNSAKALMNKIMDLENKEEKLKQTLTEANKQIALLEQHNNMLRQQISYDRKEKVKLIRKNNQSRFEINDLQEKFSEVVKKKAIHLQGVSRPTTASTHYSHTRFMRDQTILKSVADMRTEKIEERELSPSGEEEQVLGRAGSVHSNLGLSQSQENFGKGRKQKSRTVDPHEETPQNKTKEGAGVSITKMLSEKSFQSSYVLDGKKGSKATSKNDKGFLVKKYVTSQKKEL